jgi:hypothetical protein
MVSITGVPELSNASYVIVCVEGKPHMEEDMQRRFLVLLRLAGLAILLMLFLGACQPVQLEASDAAVSGGSAIAEVVITATDTSFEVPDFPAGLVTLTLKNEGTANHHGIVTQIPDDMTIDQLVEMISQEEDAPVSDVADGDGSAQAGPDTTLVMPDTDPGTSNQVTLDMPPGHWAVFSVSMDVDMTPDFARGMIAEFTVTDDGRSDTAPPVADTIITISDDDFDMPAELDAGSHTVQVKNESSVNDAFVFFIRLPVGATIDDILAEFEAFFSGKFPDEMIEFSSVGGLMGDSVSDTYWTSMDLQPGNYVAVSNIDSNDFPYSGLSKAFVVK